MTRCYSFLCLSPLVLALALAGCSKNSGEDTQNPDSVAGEGDDGSTDTDGASAKPSKARGSTSTRSAGGGTKARKMTAKKPARKPLPAPDEGVAGPNGLLATVLKFAGDKLPEDMSTLGAAVETFEVANLDIDEVDFTNGFPGVKTLKENYALQFKGSINVVAEAEYELCLHSDDGSQLLLEGMLVVDNNGVHEAPVEVCELVYLAPGEYLLEIRYFQGSGPLLALHMAWAVDGGEKVIVPTEVLFKPGTAAG
jgi:hypothetical protein